MEKETLKKIFDFLEENEGHKTPFLWKHINNIPLTEKDLNIDGNLDLTETDIELLPDGLKIAGNLNLTQTDMKLLPERLEVFGDLYLNYSLIKSLPNDLKVGGDLDIEGTDVKSLPSGLKVGGILIIIQSELLKYSDKEIRKMIEPSGYIKGDIIRS